MRMCCQAKCINADGFFLLLQVIRKKIPIRIKNVENPAGSGTVIHPDPQLDATLAIDDATAGVALATVSELHDSAVLATGGANGGANGVARPKLPTAVTIKERIYVLNINSNRKSVSHGFLAGIFGTLDRFGVVVDLISTSEVHVSMAIQGGGLGQGGLDWRTLERLVKELEKIGSVGPVTTQIPLYHELTFFL
jgi:aspartate kinase